MTRSDQIGALSAALAKAQGAIVGAPKDSANPHFQSRYADLASAWDACRAALAANGLAVVQSGSADGNLVRMTTLISHASGEWIESDPLTVQARDAAPQAIGSCLTYLRRYQLMSMVGIAPVDDDAEAAEGRHVGPAPAPVKAPQAAPRYTPPPMKTVPRAQAPEPPPTKAAPRPIHDPRANEPPMLTDKDIPF